MKVFISWAHQGEGWTGEHTKEWAAAVETFAASLDQSADVDVVLDLWHQHDRDLDWTRWGPQQVDECDWTLIIINEPWAQRWKGSNNPETGAGAVAEADALHGMFYKNQADFQHKVRLIVLPGAYKRDIPSDLWRAKCVTVSNPHPDGISDVLAELRGESRRLGGTRSASLTSTSAFLDGDMLLLRFRNLPQPTIRNHRDLLKKNDYVWWGWWKKFQENTQLDLWKSFQALVEAKGGTVGLFDSGSPAGDVRRAKVIRVLVPKMNEFDDCEAFFPDPDEWPLIPAYYRPDSMDNESVSFAWLALSNIEERPCSFFGNYEFVSSDLTYNSLIIRDPQQLKEQDQSLWHVRRAGR